MKIILASQSPRRRELLALMGLEFTVITSDVEERPPQNTTVDAYVRALALQKAEAVASQHPDDCVIGADTVVYLDGDILGKPHTPENAKKYLSRMQGRKHTVYTGVAVLAGGEEYTHVECTEVEFRALADEEIDAYVATGEPMDKAGAYGIQGRACTLIRGIRGDYYNVVGLPVCALHEMLAELDLG